MDINELIEMLNDLKSDGVTKVSLEKTSISETVFNDFRTGYIWLDGYNGKGEYINAIEIAVSE